MVGGNLTEDAQIVDKWKVYCEGLYHDDEGKVIEQGCEQESPPIWSQVARAICQTANCKATVQSRREDSTEQYAQNMCADPWKLMIG